MGGLEAEAFFRVKSSGSWDGVIPDFVSHLFVNGIPSYEIKKKGFVVESACGREYKCNGTTPFGTIVLNRQQLTWIGDDSIFLQYKTRFY